LNNVQTTTLTPARENLLVVGAYSRSMELRE
jgi:hypothetical protein